MQKRNLCTSVLLCLTEAPAMKSLKHLAVLILPLLSVRAVQAQDADAGSLLRALDAVRDTQQDSVRYETATLGELEWAQGETPNWERTLWVSLSQHGALTPYAVVEGARAAYYGPPPLQNWQLSRSAMKASRVALELEGDGPWSGPLLPAR